MSAAPAIAVAQPVSGSVCDVDSGPRLLAGYFKEVMERPPERNDIAATERTEIDFSEAVGDAERRDRNSGPRRIDVPPKLFKLIASRVNFRRRNANSTAKHMRLVTTSSSMPDSASDCRSNPGPGL
jgi:hypothetical protein